MPFVGVWDGKYTTGGTMESSFTMIANDHMNRLGIEDKQEGFRNLINFTNAVKMIESDGNGNAQAPSSSAKGFFQFVDGSVEPAINRTKRVIGDQPWFSGFNDIRELSEEQQASLFIGDLFGKTAVVDGKKVPGYGDELMKGVLEGDVGKMLQSYYTLHHTDPDDATKLRAAKEFMRIN